MLKAVYKETNRVCWVNMDFVVDVFPHGKDVIAYTFDNERGGYLISKVDFEEWMRGGEDERPNKQTGGD